MSDNRELPVVDLFAGPGGLGEGFSAYRADCSKPTFHVVLSVERDEIAHQTLELRSFFRQFPRAGAPKEYYQHVAGQLSREALFAAYRREGAAARREAWHAELGVTPHQDVINRIDAALGKHDDWVLIGGPPCQAYSVIGRARKHGVPKDEFEKDERHTLYRQYLRIIADRWPLVFVMENVKGLLSATLQNRQTFERILDDLANPNRALRRPAKNSHQYTLVPLTAQGAAQQVLGLEGAWDTGSFVVRAERHGIPQCRHRVIIVGVRDDLDLPSGIRLAERPEENYVPVSHVLRDLPPLRSGITEGKDSLSRWSDALSAALGRPWLRDLRRSSPDVADAIERAVSRASRRQLDRGAEFVPGCVSPAAYARWYRDSRLGGVLNHVTKSHMEADLHRYLFVSAFGAVCKRSPALRDFPAGLLPEHENVKEAMKNGNLFSDRFRVQLWQRPASTITAHIGRDGHYYVHPDTEQCRSLTVREAARLQTFPDNYFFCGTRTSQNGQVGNAVPPLLALKIAAAVSKILSG